MPKAVKGALGALAAIALIFGGISTFAAWPLQSFVTVIIGGSVYVVGYIGWQMAVASGRG